MGIYILQNQFPFMSFQFLGYLQILRSNRAMHSLFLANFCYTHLKSWKLSMPVARWYYKFLFAFSKPNSPPCLFSFKDIYSSRGVIKPFSILGWFLLHPFEILKFPRIENSLALLLLWSCKYSGICKDMKGNWFCKM